ANRITAPLVAADPDGADSAVRIAACNHQAARFRLRTETFGWAAEVVDVARRMAHRKLPLLLTMASDSAWGLGSLEEAKRYGTEAISMANDVRFEPFVWACIDLAQIALFEGDVDAALDLLHAGAAHPADQEDRLVLACLHGFGAMVGRQPSALAMEEGLAQITVAGMPTAVAFA